MVEYRPTTITNQEQLYTSKGSIKFEGEPTTNMVGKDPTRDMTSPEKAQQPLKQRVRNRIKEEIGLKLNRQILCYTNVLLECTQKTRRNSNYGQTSTNLPKKGTDRATIREDTTSADLSITMFGYVC